MTFYKLFLRIEDIMIPCINKIMFGFECPGCGLQRSLIKIIHGEFKAAFVLYPAVYPLLLLMGFIALNQKIKFKYARSIILSMALINAIIIIGSYLVKMNVIQV